MSSQYVTYDEFVGSPYGADYLPGESIFTSSGQVNEFLTYISGLVDMFCGRSFGIAEYQQYVDGCEANVLFLDVIPVTGVVSVDYDVVGGGASGTLASSAYTLFKNTGKMKFVSRLTHDYIYTITYRAGYTTIPDQIKLATLMWANIAAQAIDNGAVATPDGGSVTEFRFNKFWEAYVDPRQRQIGDCPPSVYAILKRFRYLS